MMATVAYRIGACLPQRCSAHLVAYRRLADGTAFVITPKHPEDDANEWAIISGLSRDARYNRRHGIQARGIRTSQSMTKRAPMRPGQGVCSW
jgi:hypothetical protein